MPLCNFFRWFAQCFRRSFDFKGRACRKEFWSFLVLTSILNIFVYSVFVITQNTSCYYLSFIIFIVLVISMTSACVRRLHDIGLSGKLIFIFYGAVITILGYGIYTSLVTVSIVNFQPETGSPAMWNRFFAAIILSFVLLIISIIFFILMLRKGSGAENRYGANYNYLD